MSTLKEKFRLEIKLGKLVTGGIWPQKRLVNNISTLSSKTYLIT